MCLMGKRPILRRKSVLIDHCQEEIKDIVQYILMPSHNFERKVFYRLDKIDVEIYEIYETNLYKILVPKNPSRDFLPMMCAHINTQIHSVIERLSYTDITELFMCNTRVAPLEVKDKLSCWIVNTLIELHPNDFIFAFFKRNKNHMDGVTEFLKSPERHSILAASSCFIAADKQGCQEFATGGFDSKTFLNTVNSLNEGHNHVLSVSSTEAFLLADETLKSSINFSSGHFNEGTSSECVRATVPLQTVSSIINFMKTLNDIPYVCDEKSMVNRIHMKNYIQETKTEEEHHVALSNRDEHFHKNFGGDFYVHLVKQIVSSIKDESTHSIQSALREINMVTYLSKFTLISENQYARVKSVCKEYNVSSLSFDVTDPLDSALSM